MIALVFMLADFAFASFLRTDFAIDLRNETFIEDDFPKMELEWPLQSLQQHKRTKRAVGLTV